MGMAFSGQPSSLSQASADLQAYRSPFEMAGDLCSFCLFVRSFISFFLFDLCVHYMCAFMTLCVCVCILCMCD